MKFRVSRKLFAHIDCDSFFASCEILKNPSLKWKYVCVWDEIIVACTYNAKALGIKTWTPIWEAKRILGDKWIFLSGNMWYYQSISSDLMGYLKNNTLNIEEFSIDEAFCEITGLAIMYKVSLLGYIKKLQKDILKEIWIPVSIWVSNTRIKAKIFSKINKPNWIFISLDKIVDKEIFSKLPLSIIPYIWKSYQEKLKYKATSVYDFINLWYYYLKKDIWKNATDLWLELVWINAFIVKKSNKIKSMSRWRSFNKNITSNKIFLYKQLLINFNFLYEEFINKNLELKTISIFLRDKNFETNIYKYDLIDFTHLRYEILLKIKHLFQENIFLTNKYYRSTWVIFSNFKTYKPYQTSIFDKPIKDKNNYLKLSKTLNEINEKYWNHKLTYWTSLLGLWNNIKLWIRK